MRCILLLPILFAAMPLSAQDRINLMNGQVIEGKVLGQSSLEIRYLLDKNGRLVEREEPTESVFSVTDSLGREKVWYFMDTLFGNDLTIPQMRWFMACERDARKGADVVELAAWTVVGNVLLNLDETLMKR